MLSAQLVVRGGKHEGKSIVLNRGRFLIGREQDCNLRPSSDLVSRHHCVFHVDDYTVRLRDLGSTNGTLVNGERLHGEKTLNAGDKIAVGKLTFELNLKDVAEADAAPELPKEQALPVDGADTSYEMPAYTGGDAGNDTRFSPGAASGPGGGQPGGDQPGGGDTATFPVPQPGYGPPPGYGDPQQAPQQYPGYPPQYPGYPPQYPGYPPQYPGYPPQYPGYPPQYAPYPQQGGPPPGGPAQGSPEGGGGESGGRVKAPPIQLPPPPKRD